MFDDSGSLCLVLTELLKDRALVPPNTEGSIILQERSANMKVEIANSSHPLVVINVKSLNHLSMLKDGQWRKICDYLLVTEYDNKMRACFVELKKTLSNKPEHREQLRRSLPILEYLRSVCKIECEGIDLGAGLTVRYNLIAERQNGRIDKQRVRTGPSDWPVLECYRDIAVRKFVGSRILISKLL